MTLMKANLYNWFFHYNPYTQKWNGVHRDYAIQYLTDPNKIPDTHKVSSSSFEVCTFRASRKDIRKEKLNYST